MLTIVDLRLSAALAAQAATWGSPCQWRPDRRGPLRPPLSGGLTAL
jgi:hypothetical protein